MKAIMKSGRTAAVVAAALAASSVDATGFGPANCVSLSRSNAGTCVVKTNCKGQDLSNLDISFDCVSKAGQQTHSLGVGSFDLVEEYDTDLKCQQCSPPASKQANASKPLAKRAKASAGVSLAAISREVTQLRGGRWLPGDDLPLVGKAEDSKPKAEWYGPDECVGVWRDSKTGTCVMETDCDADTQLSVYEFGMLCADQNGDITRHIFGMGSFGHKETFNTLVKCEECLALDEYQNGNKGVDKLTKMVKDMKNDLMGVSTSVMKLNAQVFGGAPGPAPAPAAAKKEKLLLSKQNVVEPKVVPPMPVAAPQPVVPAASQQQQPLPAQAAQDAGPVEQVEVIQDAGPTPAGNAEAEVQHVKVRASQQAAPQPSIADSSSVQDVLAAAVKGAVADGVVMAPGQKKVLSQLSQQAQVVKQQVLQLQAAQQQVAQQVSEAAAQQAVVMEHKKKASASQTKDDDDAHGKDESDEDSDDDDGFD